MAQPTQIKRKHEWPKTRINWLYLSDCFGVLVFAARRHSVNIFGVLIIAFIKAPGSETLA